MHCGQFRQFYSDFTDGLLDEAEEVAFHVHMAECIACRRFDAALEQGRSALRRMEPPRADGGDFESRLFDRILRENQAERSEPVLRQFSGMAGAVLIVAVVGVMGWNVRTAMRPQTAPFRQASGAGSTTELFFQPSGADSAFLGRARLASDTTRRVIEVGNDEMFVR